MDFLKTLAISEGASVVLIAGTWYWVLQQGRSREGWRSKASHLALILASFAATIQFVLAMIGQFHPLQDMDSASLQGGWSAFAARLWLWSFFATGLFSFGGLGLALLGKAPARFPACVWSSVTIILFLINLVLAVNSFH